VLVGRRCCSLHPALWRCAHFAPRAVGRRHPALRLPAITPPIYPANSLSVLDTLPLVQTGHDHFTAQHTPIQPSESHPNAIERAPHHGDRKRRLVAATAAAAADRSPPCSAQPRDAVSQRAPFTARVPIEDHIQAPSAPPHTHPTPRQTSQITQRRQPARRQRTVRETRDLLAARGAGAATRWRGPGRPPREPQTAAHKYFINGTSLKSKISAPPAGPSEDSMGVGRGGGGRCARGEGRGTRSTRVASET